MKIVCGHCGKRKQKKPGEINRAMKIGLRLFCDRRCAGLARRKGKTKAQKKNEKRLYDMNYRRENLATIKAKRAAYFQATYDPEKARIERKKKAKAHAEYCRQPEYRAWKASYDRKRRDAEYGPFAEVFRLTIDLNREIKQRSSNHEIKWQNGTCNKTQFRRRADKEKERSRPRIRDRRDRHQAIIGK